MRFCYKHRKIFFILLLIFFPLISSNLLHAQLTDFDPEFYFQNSISLQRSGMIVLGTWAVLNLVTGVTGNFTTQNSTKYFFQMNAAWNTVNLGIAAYALSGIQDLHLINETGQMLEEMKKLDKILLINAGLDVIYIGVGSYLLHRGLQGNSNRLIGYGRSMMVQGGFLLAFDAVLFLLHRPNTKGLYQITENLSITASGFSYAF